ncbi:hypothetical protein [Kytococcus schroeteri]|nr:hypothetical protein [Kytococcus schroeteri]
MNTLTRRSALGAIVAAATGAATAAHAEPEHVYETRNEVIDLKASNVTVTTPVPGAMSTGQFTVANESRYALPEGYQVTLRFRVVDAPSVAGRTSGTQSYVSTTATPSSGSLRVKFSGATDAKVGTDGVATATVAHRQRAGLGIYGTWSGAHIVADGENAHATQRYRVVLECPSRTMEYTTLENRADGAMVTVKHVVTIKGGTFELDRDL